MKRSEQLQEFRALDLKGLEAAIAERKKTMMELRFKQAVGQLENPAQMGALRKEVARLATLATSLRAEQALGTGKAGK